MQVWLCSKNERFEVATNRPNWTEFIGHPVLKVYLVLQHWKIFSNPVLKSYLHQA